MQPIPAEPFFPTALGLILGALPLVVVAGIVILRSRKVRVGESAVVVFLVLLAAWAYAGTTFFTHQNAEARYELARAELERVYGLDSKQASQVLSLGRAGYLGYDKAPDTDEAATSLVDIDTDDVHVQVNVQWNDDAFRLFTFDPDQGFVELERQ